MALLFPKERKGRKYLNWIFLIVILAGLLWFGRSYLIKPSPQPPPPPKKKTIEINLEVLKSPAIQGLQPFDEIAPFEGEIGRENPFLPY